MSNNEFLSDPELFLRDTHVVLTSGRHGDAYFNKRVLPLRPKRAVDICLRISDRFRNEGIELVVGLEKGATSLGFEVARLLNVFSDSDVLSVTAEKQGDGFFVPDYFHSHVKGCRTLVVEDVITTGGSVKRGVMAAREAGADVFAVACVLNRGESTADSLGVPSLFPCIELTLPDWEAKACPLCEKGVSINTNVGHGAAFLKQQDRARVLENEICQHWQVAWDAFASLETGAEGKEDELKTTHAKHVGELRKLLKRAEGEGVSTDRIERVKKDLERGFCI